LKGLAPDSTRVNILVVMEETNSLARGRASSTDVASIRSGFPRQSKINEVEICWYLLTLFPLSLASPGLFLLVLKTGLRSHRCSLKIRAARRLRASREREMFVAGTCLGRYAIQIGITAKY